MTINVAPASCERDKKTDLFCNDEQLVSNGHLRDRSVCSSCLRLSVTTTEQRHSKNRSERKNTAHARTKAAHARPWPCLDMRSCFLNLNIQIIFAGPAIAKTYLKIPESSSGHLRRAYALEKGSFSLNVAWSFNLLVVNNELL